MLLSEESQEKIKSSKIGVQTYQEVPEFSKQSDNDVMPTAGEEKKHVRIDLEKNQIFEFENYEEESEVETLVDEDLSYQDDVVLTESEVETVMDKNLRTPSPDPASPTHSVLKKRKLEDESELE